MIDYVKEAIDRSDYQQSIDGLLPQEWEVFDNASVDKNIVIWGAGNGLLPAIYVLSQKQLQNVSALIDNGDKKRGQVIECFLGYNPFGESCNQNILDESILDEIEDKSTVFLVTNLMNIEAVVSKLLTKGFCNIFSFLEMERNGKDTRRTQEYINELERIESSGLVENRVVVTAHIHGGHCKSIIEKLHNIQNNTEIYMLVDRIKQELPQYIHQIAMANTDKVIEIFSTAKIWIVDVVTLPRYISKRDEQIFIQVKHWASVTLKKFGVEDRQGNYEDAHKWNELTDYIIVGSVFDMESCKNGFEFRGPYICAGSPRSDILFDMDKKKNLKNFDVNMHYLLYSPTFRAPGGKIDPGGVINLDYERIYKGICQKFGGDWKVILKLHPLVAECADNISLPEFVVNFSKYQDIEELVAISDCMITDYSSVMFEPAFIGKPVFLYAPDLQDYLKNEKDLLLDYYDLPFPIARDETELIDNIENFNSETYQNKLKRFMSCHGVYEDGHASERVALFIKDLIKNELKEISYYENYLR